MEVASLAMYLFWIKRRGKVVYFHGEEDLLQFTKLGCINEGLVFMYVFIRSFAQRSSRNELENHTENEPYVFLWILANLRAAVLMIY